MSRLDHLPPLTRHAALRLALQDPALLVPELAAQIEAAGGAQALLESDRGTEREVFTSGAQVRRRFFPNAEDCPHCEGSGIKRERSKIPQLSLGA